MQRDQTNGLIREPKIHEVIEAIIGAVETTGCTRVEEAVALETLLLLLAEKMRKSERRDAERSTAGVYALYKVFGG